MADKLFSIVILSWNRLEYTKQTVECIIKKTKVPHILTLVDNFSAPESAVRDYLSSINESNTNARKVFHVFNGKNLGVAGGRNSGIYAVEQSGLAPQYLFNVDDDILVPDDYDKHLIDVCDKVPGLGITGINVEPVKYPVKVINGVRCRPKQYNLGGAALCLPRRVFSKIGFYGFGRGTLYSQEDVFMNKKLTLMGLIGAYIEPHGIHLDVNKDKLYRGAKDKSHSKGSIQLQEFSKAVKELLATKNIYTPYISEEQYNPIDGDIFTNDLLKKG